MKPRLNRICFTGISTRTLFFTGYGEPGNRNRALSFFCSLPQFRSEKPVIDVLTMNQESTPKSVFWHQTTKTQTCLLDEVRQEFTNFNVMKYNTLCKLVSWWLGVKSSFLTFRSRVQVGTSVLILSWNKPKVIRLPWVFLLHQIVRWSWNYEVDKLKQQHVQ